MSSDTNSLAHTKWNCKYHIVFAPKYRRQILKCDFCLAFFFMLIFIYKYYEQLKRGRL